MVIENQKHQYLPNANQLKHRLRLAKSVIKLIHAQFIQARVTLFFTFFFSIVFVILFGYLNMFGFSQNIGSLFMSFIVGIITFQIIQTGCQTLPESIVSFKQSVLLKRIGATPIKPFDFIVIASIYYFLIILIQFAWIILWIIIAFGFYEFKTGIGEQTEWGIHFLFQGNIDWPGFIFAGIYLSILSVIAGVFIASISKSTTQMQIFASIFFFSSMLFGGNLIPMSSIDKIEALKFISLLVPLRSVNTLTYVAWNSPSPNAVFKPWENIVFDFGIPGDVTDDYVIESWMMWYSWLIPVVFIIIFVLLSIKFFKWSSR
ncbi:MAG: ABC transporter permease [Mycoplasmoidaceae bacterium]